MHWCPTTPVVCWYATQTIEGSFGGPCTVIMYTRHKEVLVDSCESKQTCQWISLISMLHHDWLAGNLPLNFPREWFLPGFRQSKSFHHTQPTLSKLASKGKSCVLEHRWAAASAKSYEISQLVIIPPCVHLLWKPKTILNMTQRIVDNNSLK